jgi:hypothetical protein
MFQFLKQLNNKLVRSVTFRGVDFSPRSNALMEKKYVSCPHPSLKS